MLYLLFLVFVASTIWVGVDAGRRDWSGDRFADTPTKWVLGMVLFWIIVFPVYLARRGNAPQKVLNP
jgi:hypothetical protein